MLRCAKIHNTTGNIHELKSRMSELTVFKRFNVVGIIEDQKFYINCGVVPWNN